MPLSHPGRKLRIYTCVPQLHALSQMVVMFTTVVTVRVAYKHTCLQTVAIFLLLSVHLILKHVIWQMVAGYEHQLKMLSLNAPVGLSVSTALHAASVGEERFNKGDCRGSSRLFRYNVICAYDVISRDV